MPTTPPIPRSGLPRFYEASSQQSLRERNSAPKQWHKGRQTADQTESLVNNVAELQRQLVRLQRRSAVGEIETEQYFPFKIYQSPADPAASPAWLNFRVRSGLIALAIPAGTDNVDFPDLIESKQPDSTPNIPDYDNPAIDFTVASNTTHYVWINTTTTPTVENSATPPVAGWSTASGWDDGSHILLGWIDAVTGNASKKAYVRQIVRTDLFCVPDITA